MKQLAIGNSEDCDLNGTALPGYFIKLTGDIKAYTDANTANHVIISIHIGAGEKLLDAAANITITPKVGDSSPQTKPLLTHVVTKLAGATEVIIQTEPIILTAIDDNLRIYVHSDNANDTDVTVVATVMEVNSFDANGRVDVGNVIGTPPTLSSDNLDVNVVSTGDATPISLADILGQVYAALSSEVTDVATADSTTSFTLAAGTSQESAYVGQLIAIKDADTDIIVTREIITYTGQRVVTVNRAFPFTPAENDIVWILNSVGSVAALAAIYLDHLCESDGGFQANALADINAQVDGALNTAIPGSPENHSINERVKSMDVLTEASGDGDLAAILTDTETTIPNTITTAQNDLNTITGSNGVLIDDNAITAAKYDESTAYPIKSADTSSTQIARVGADGDTLETLSDQIDLLADAVTEPMLNTTVGATVTSATVFNLTAGVGNNDAYIDATITVMDNSNSDLAEWRTIVDYVGSTKTVTLDRALSFTPEASTDEVIIKGKTRNNNVAGGTSVTYTVTDDGTSGGNAVPDVHVWVTIDSAGNTIVASGDTDSEGEVEVFLDLGGTYYFWKHKAGFTFTDQPEEYTVV